MVAGSVRLGTRRGTSTAEVDDAIDDAVGLGQPTDVLEPHDGRAFASSGVWPTSNTAILSHLRVEAPFTITNVSIFVTTASGNVDVGVYQTDDGIAFTLLGSSGSVAAAGASAMQTIALTAPVTVTPVRGRRFYLAMAANNTTVSVARFVNILEVGAFGRRVLSKATTFPLANISGPIGKTYVPYLAAT